MITLKTWKKHSVFTFKPSKNKKEGRIIEQSTSQSYLSREHQISETSTEENVPCNLKFYSRLQTVINRNHNLNENCK